MMVFDVVYIEFYVELGHATCRAIGCMLYNIWSILIELATCRIRRAAQSVSIDLLSACYIMWSKMVELAS